MKSLIKVLFSFTVSFLLLCSFMFVIGFVMQLVLPISIRRLFGIILTIVIVYIFHQVDYNVTKDTESRQ